MEGLSFAKLSSAPGGCNNQLLLLLLLRELLRWLDRQPGPSVEVQRLHGGNLGRGDLLRRHQFAVEHVLLRLVGDGRTRQVELTLRALIHVSGPVLLLARVITVRGVPTAVKEGLFAAVDAPLLLLGFLHRTDTLDVALLADLVDEPCLLQVHVLAHLAQYQVRVVLELGDFLLVAVLQLLDFQLEHLDLGLEGATVVGQVGQRVLDDGAEKVGHLKKLRFEVRNMFVSLMNV